MVGGFVVEYSKDVREGEDLFVVVGCFWGVGVIMRMFFGRVEIVGGGCV